MSAPGPVRTALRWFLAMTPVAGGVALADRAGLLSHASASRALGLVLGTSVLLIGNWLPKLRPLQRGRRVPAGAAASERLAGWSLACAGLAMDGLFAFAAADRARPAAALLGLAALLVVAVDWLWLLRTSRGVEVSGLARPPAESATQWLVTSLLFALGYVCACGCAALLSSEAGPRDGRGGWLTVAFSAACAVLFAYAPPSTPEPRR